jgi:hypothetical protein
LYNIAKVFFRKISKMIGISEIRMQLETAEREIASLEGGRKASAARARKALQIIKGLSHTLRKQVVEYSKGLPTKKRAEAVAVEPTEAPETKPKPKAPKAPRRQGIE